jgi:hypothetical protein
VTLANNSATTGGSGDVIATHLVSSKEHELVMLATPDGHIVGTEPSYILYQQPRTLTAAVTDFFDLFNATGSGKVIRLIGLYPVLESTAAWTQGSTYRFDLIRTSAVGTGGTAYTSEGTAAPAAGALNITRLSTADASVLTGVTQITARSLPTAGATAAAFWFSVFLQPEETNAASSMAQWVNLFPVLPTGNIFELQENQGFKVRQITTTGTLTGTNFGWLLSFTVIP